MQTLNNTLQTLNDQQRRAMIAYGGKAQAHIATSEANEFLSRVDQAKWDIDVYGAVQTETAEEMAKEAYDMLFTLPQLFAYIASHVPNFWQMVEDAGKVEQCRMEQRLQKFL